MRQSAILFLFYLSTSASSYSQSVYPRAIVINGDTVVVFTTEQADSVLSICNQLDEERALNKSLEEEVDTCRKVVSQLEQKAELSSQDSTKQAALVSTRDDKISTLETANKKLQRKSKAVGVIVYISSALAAAFAIIAAVK